MKKSCLLILLIIFLTACSKNVTNEYLVGGHWVGTAGYEDEEIGGEPICPPFHEGMEFKDEDTVYVDANEDDFEYRLRDTDDGVIIEFYNPNGFTYYYHINVINDDGIGLIGTGDFQGDESCYLERK